ncbi:GH92 family glycosyl hydrolase [Luteibacter sp. PPL201]|uniref:GH92 family glycosyl hydrolase n=1 Tax=Luteibacter sahnii TaxID=3021977 RepID=A0ABT6BCT8_9GAMM|nr:GH92 family glycosyl hydrolase [Luteibacter sp. PPL193]MDY1549285.1 GH92 family glycosyl hydrolase [Luteibacter sp. PPL193]
MSLTRRDFLRGTVGTALLAGRLPAQAFAAASPTTAPDDAVRRYVDPFIGTGSHGHTYPGATTPFGMVQLSPDTYNADWDVCSGYHTGYGSIMGFSHTHLSGTGIGDMMDVLLMPATGDVRLVPGAPDAPPGSGYRSRFDKADETASPGFYRVRLKDDGIDAELTATARTGLHRYTFAHDASGHVVLDLCHGMQDNPQTPTRVSDATLRVVDTRTVTGGRRVHQWAKGRHIYFALRTSRPFAKAALYADDANVPDAHEVAGAHLKAVLHFPDAGHAPLLVKVGLSNVSADAALRNLDAEQPGFDFERVRGAAEAAWEQELSRIRVQGGSERDKRIFYTALYHSMVAPTLASDVDGGYRGMDGQVHRLPRGTSTYTTYSLWDTYRAVHPLLTLVQPRRVPALVNSLARMAVESPDGPPVWPLQSVETGCMIGYHSAVVLAEAQAKGFTGIDYAKAWPVYRKRAMTDDYRGLPDYRRLGFVPADKEWEAASKTLEYAYDDWAVAHLARGVGADDDYRHLVARSRNYRNVFNRDSDFVQPRLADGRWATPFDPRALGHGKAWHDFTECNAWQATFLNQHDLYGYIPLFGGDDAFAAKLDGLFNANSELPPDAPPDIAGMVGQYAHGNEPSHHVAYLYAYAGQHHKTQARVRSLLASMYQDTPEGLIGNEDCGQMSAWYVMSALGFYAVDPVSANYVIGSPLFERVRIDVGQGRTLIVEALDNGPDHVYIQSVTWNGAPYTRTWLRHADLSAGGHLVFRMGPRPAPDYGTARADRPPSFVPEAG